MLTLKHESLLAVKWFTENQMIVNPNKLKVQKLKQKIELKC